MITVKRLNHAVMWVRDAQRSFEFYRDVLGFELVRARAPRPCGRDTGIPRFEGRHHDGD
jgi:catechol 2,3-dioxygenase-like lactoylglutathione lyase family enzyme